MSLLVIIMVEKITFSFGKNWQNFLKSVNKDRLRNAELSLTEFLGCKDLKNKTFLDIGCGSGIFSYAAFALGAKRVVSFDFDPFSVECCKYFHKKANNPKNWEVYPGSILDKNFISKLGKFDIVYSWGVLHHTGDLWNAIKNSAKLVKEKGYYYIAIYNKVGGTVGSEFWLNVKKNYNASPLIIKRLLESGYIMTWFMAHLVRFENPVKNIKNRKSLRGMNWRVDINDWLGGYPYEFATVEEIFKFMKLNFPDFQLINIKTTNWVGNNTFLFKKNKD